MLFVWKLNSAEDMQIKCELLEVLGLICPLEKVYPYFFWFQILPTHLDKVVFGNCYFCLHLRRNKKRTEEKQALSYFKLNKLA